jgi:hypothetical protein
MHRRLLTLIILGLAAAFTLVGCRQTLVGTDSAEVELSTDDALSSRGGVRRYRVTIENLTSSQPFSPGAAVTHSRRASWFHIGGRASEGIRLIAENGDPAAALAELEGAPGVSQVVLIPAPTGCRDCPGPFGTAQRFEIDARGNAHELSLAVMLICTNDGFTGVHDIRLPGGFRPVTYYAQGYDAGTEANDERLTSIVDACGAIGPEALPADGSNDRTAERKRIRIHPGIDGSGDLDPATHGWRNPVAKITIQRLGHDGGRGDDDDDE